MTQKIFANDLNTRLEYSESNFNTQRKAAIRYAIESNLSTAIANFNFYSESTNEFQMPKLKETEWELVENQVSIISFLQGISIGGKIYNGHTVVTNDKTEEVIKEEDINIIKAGDEYYHKINDTELNGSYVTAGNKIIGVWNIDFEMRRNQHTGLYYVPRTQIGCYSSVVAQNNVNNRYDTVYEYLNDSKNIISDDEETAYEVKQAYYTALGRERWGMYKIENPSSIITILNEMVVLTQESNGIVTNGLIRYYLANNTDGYGKNGDISHGFWRDLTWHKDGKFRGSPATSTNKIQLDGVNDWIDLGVINEEYITLSIKMSYNNLPGRRYLLSNWETNYSGIGFLIDPDGKVSFTLNRPRASSKKVQSNSLQRNRVYDITGTYDGQYLKIYIDGVLQRTTSYAGKIVLPAKDTVLGVGANTDGSSAESWGGFANIDVYSIKVYDRALTADEVQKNFNANE